MRRIDLARWAAPLGVVFVLHAPLQAQTSTPELPVSLDHVRTALEQAPPVLQTPVRTAKRPTFRVEVRQPLWTEHPVDEPAFDPTYGLPSAGELLVGAIEKVHFSLVNYKHRRAERRAKQEVAEALAAFCAVHSCPAPRAPK
jgi:hypothetical protein